MSKFKVGDMARFTGAGEGFFINSGENCVGHEVLIVSNRYWSEEERRYCYDTICNICYPGEPVETWEESLEPLQKRPELGTIEELKMITGGWTPGHITKRKVNS